jgi:PHD/YefM family antitoxin component YafN of YafNO toxin-antitoxin module
MKGSPKEVSVKEFQRNAARLLRQIRRTSYPLVLTEGNEEQFVIEDVASYRRMLQLILKDQLDAIKGICKGLRDLKKRRIQSAKEAFEEIRRKHKIPRAK